MPDYASAADFRDYLGKSRTSGKLSDAAIEPYLDEAEDFVNWGTGNYFGSPSPEGRTFWGLGVDLLEIDPCYEITAVRELANDGTATALAEGTDWLPGEPTQRGDYAQYITLRRLPNGGYSGDWGPANGWPDYGYQRHPAQGWRSDRRYEVTARFGMATVPPGIKLAVMELAAIRRIESRRAEQAAVIEGDGMDLSPAARGIVDKYLRRWWRVDLLNPKGKR